MGAVQFLRQEPGSNEHIKKFAAFKGYKGKHA